MAGELKVTIEPWGPTQAQIEASAVHLITRLKTRPQSDVQLLQIRPVYALPAGRRKKADYADPTRFHATLFDYEQNVAIRAAGDVRDPDQVDIHISNEQPTPVPAEFQKALQVLHSEDSEFLPALHAGRYAPGPMMPLLIEDVGADGRMARTIPVALYSRSPGLRHVIVGVRLSKTEERRIFQHKVFEDKISKEVLGLCGQPEDTRTIIAMQQPGAAWVTISDGTQEIWRFLAIRPQNTGDISSFPPERGEASATNGAGIELWDVDYRGEQVFRRANVPIITVKYNKVGTGPYRDVGFFESAFDAVGTDRVSGVRECTQRPTTILESGNDAGTFDGGIAVYADPTDDSVVLVSEMLTSYYRYDCRWKFYPGGEIQSMFGFGAVENRNTCFRHHHHVYWRLDFDIGARGDSEAAQVQSGTSTPIPEEDRRDRGAGDTWTIVSRSTTRGWELIPGGPDVNDDRSYAAPPTKGDNADIFFGAGDVWILNYHADNGGDAKAQEIDDGGSTALRDSAKLDQFVADAEKGDPDLPLTGHPVVWYGGHCTHDEAEDHEHPPHPTFAYGHTVGFTLKPI